MSKRFKKVCDCGSSLFKVEIEQRGIYGVEFVTCSACNLVLQETDLDVEVIESLNDLHLEEV